MKDSLKFLIYLWLVVITDPYSSIKYDEIQVYEFKKKLRKIQIEVHCAEGHDDCHNLTEHKEEPAKKEESFDEPVFCYVCNPPQWLY
jgi:hypothetical protein